MENGANNQKIIHDLNPKSEISTLSFARFFSLLAVIVVLGIIVGFTVAKINSRSSQNSGSQSKTAGSDKSAGIADKKTFKDKAEGVLREGGADGEGNFHLERPGGDSQSVYLTSTTVDLSQYLGKKVRVWGETFKAQKAGWLMDVGLVEVL